MIVFDSENETSTLWTQTSITTSFTYSGSTSYLGYIYVIGGDYTMDNYKFAFTSELPANEVYIYTNNMSNYSFDLIDNYKIQCIKEKNENVDKNNTITEEIILKILTEKVFIKTFINRDIEYFLDIKNMNFDYIKYNNEDIKEYFLSHKSNIEVLSILVKEKIINLSSLLQFDDFPLDKLIKYLRNF